MLAKLRLELADDSLTYRQSSLLQGVLFERVDSDTARVMHQQALHPYSQYLQREGGKTAWYIQTLTDEAFGHMIQPLLSAEFTGFDLEKTGRHIEIVSKKLSTVQDRQLIDEFNTVPADRAQGLRFVTPTAFRQNGSFCLLPEPRLVYQSLMARYSCSSSDYEMTDQDTLDQLEQNTIITRYQLRTETFPLEGKNIPGFAGTVFYRINGPETMRRYARLLFHFGEYCGIGVKTGIGMGAVRLLEKTGTERRQSSGQRTDQLYHSGTTA
ncbi:MAG: CRISPR-associated endoribonuclease Cas6 [Lachnospiraceae bacterium]|jgi:CRISPR-associated endoribonuclease Cas6